VPLIETVTEANETSKTNVSANDRKRLQARLQCSKMSSELAGA